MIRSRNVAYNIESVTLIPSAGTAATYRAPIFINSFPFKVRVKKAAFHVIEKGTVGTSFTADLHKNGTTIMATAPVCTTASLGANYSVKFDTDKTITATAPTGVSALPALSSTVATVTLSPGDALELVSTTVGTYTVIPRLLATVTIEAVSP